MKTKEIECAFVQVVAVIYLVVMILAVRTHTVFLKVKCVIIRFVTRIVRTARVLLRMYRNDRVKC